MRTSRISTAVLALLVLSAGCVFYPGGTTVKASGKLGEQTREVAPFDRIAVWGRAKLEVTVGSPQSVVLKADDNILPLVETETSGRTLKITTHGSIRDSYGHGITLRITVPALAGVEVGGACTATLEGLGGPQFSVDISGAATLHASGHADDVQVHVSGSGEIDMEKVIARRATVDVSGAGHVKLHASEELDAKVSGVGDIRYAGRPARIQQKVHGVGRIEPL